MELLEGREYKYIGEDKYVTKGNIKIKEVTKNLVRGNSSSFTIPYFSANYELIPLPAMEVLTGREYEYIGELAFGEGTSITVKSQGQFIICNNGCKYTKNYFSDNYQLLPEPPAVTSPLNLQVSGIHYKKEGIQPIEYIAANNLDYKQGNVLKYIQRHAKKNKEKDLAKALHYIFLMMEEHYDLSIEDSLKIMGYDIK